MLGGAVRLRAWAILFWFVGKDYRLLNLGKLTVLRRLTMILYKDRF